MSKKQNNFITKSFNHEIYIMRKAADKAAFGLIRDFGELEKLQISKKGTSNYVTSADIRSESKIIEELKAFKNIYPILSEEAGQINLNESEFSWVIDPIDGTNNFRRGIPYFCINIALTQNNEPVAALTLDPIRSTCYKAIINMGGLIDGNSRLRVSRANKIEESVIACHSVPLEIMSKLEKEHAIIRQTGSVALDLAYVAAGKYDAMIAHNVAWWDIAPGILLVKESGGFVKYFETSKNKFSITAASSNKLLGELIS